LPDELAKFSEDLWPNPSPVLDVAIGEREVAALRMPAGRKIPPLQRLLVEDRTPGRDTEVGIEDAILVDTNEEEQFRWRWSVDFGFLGEARGEERLVVIRRAIDGLAQVVATRPPKMQGFTFRRSYSRFVGRTPIDVG